MDTEDLFWNVVCGWIGLGFIGSVLGILSIPFAMISESKKKDRK